MLNFIKHKWTHREKFMAKWGVSHFMAALIIGGLMAAVLVIGQRAKDETRVAVLETDANGVTVQTQTQNAPMPPQSGNIGGPFDLTDDEGRPVSDKDFTGKYLLIYFGYASCPDMCPTGLKSMSIALDRLGAEADTIQPLFISVDPPRDTPEKLKQYISSYNHRIKGLTGTATQIANVAREFQVYYQKGEGDQDYEVEHSTLIYLMNPSGKLVATFNENADPQTIITALHNDEAALAPQPASSKP